MFKKKYRIVTDRHCGYEVQSRRLLFWTQEWYVNTNRSIKEARERIASNNGANKVGIVVWTEGDE